MAKTHSSYLRQEIFDWQAYAASPSGFSVKLDAMESPYRLDNGLGAAWQEKLAACEINRYPESKPHHLHERLARYAEVPDSCRLLFGNGSDELIQLIMLALARPGNRVLSPRPSFAVYPMVADIVGMEYIEVALHTADFSLDADAMLGAIAEKQPALVCLAQPNNPTGNLWSAEVVEAIVEQTPGYILIDEAYAPFASRNYINLLDKHPNVLILRTFSKIGFAGLRFGFLIGSEDCITQLDKLRLPYNTGALVHCGIEFALDHFDYFQAKLDEICRLRDDMKRELSQLPGVTTFASETNFILFRLPTADRAKQTFEALKQSGILIKHFPTDPDLQAYLRVTVGSAEENRAFIRALKVILQQGGT